MENTNSWIPVKPKREVIYLEKPKASIFDNPQKSSKQASKPGDIFRTPETLQEKAKNNSLIANPFNFGS